MKINLIFSLLLLMTSFQLMAGDDGYKINIKIEGYESEEPVRMGYHFGDKQYLTDSVTLDDKGYGVFEGEEALKGGIYFIVVPEHGFFEFIVTEQHFSLETKLDDYAGSMKVKGSEENTVYYDYLKFIQQQNVRANEFKALRDSTSKTDEKAKWQEALTKLDKEVKQFRRRMEKQHPNSFTVKFLKSYDEVKVPDAPKDANGNITDSLFQYKYYKAHFFDNVDLTDNRMARTPVLDKKVKKYLDNVIPQIPDSLVVAVDRLLIDAKPAEDVFKYFSTLMLNKYAKSKIMGQDAVYVHLVDNYFAKGMTTWVDSVQLFKIKDRADMMRPNLIGKQAPPLRLKDRDGEWHDIYKMEAEYIVLYFWDPDCGHCKKSTPKIVDFYENYKAKGVQVIAITTEHEEDKWLKYLDEKQLPFLNLADLNYRNNFRRLYDISGTPRIFILDKDRKIVGKRIGAEQLPMFMDMVIK